MTEYACNKKVCELGETIDNLLRASKDDFLAGYRSVIASIAEGTQTPGKGWVISAFYSTGDLVGFNGELYVCLQDNQGSNPESERRFWTPYKIPFYENKGKIGGYIQVKGDGTLIKKDTGIISLTKNTSSKRYTLTLDTSKFVNYPTFLFSSLESSSVSFFEFQLETYDPDTGELDFRILEFGEDMPVSTPAIYDSLSTEYFSIMIYGRND